MGRNFKQYIKRKRKFFWLRSLKGFSGKATQADLMGSKDQPEENEKSGYNITNRLTAARWEEMN